jgi:hypothetical protein
MPNLATSLKTFIARMEVPKKRGLLFSVTTHGNLNGCNPLFFKLKLGSRHLPKVDGWNLREMI